MPTYEFTCPDCDHHYTVTCTIDEYEKMANPICTSDSPDSHPYEVLMNRVFTPPSFSIEGLPPDRFTMQDKVAENRQKAYDQGAIDDGNGRYKYGEQVL